MTYRLRNILYKSAAIKVPTAYVAAIADPYLEDFQSVVDDYRQSVEDELEEGDDDYNNLWVTSEFKSLLKYSLIENYSYSRYMGMPKIPLKNKEAERILHSVDIVIKEDGGNVKGSINLQGPRTIEMRLYPVAIVDNIGPRDFDDIVDAFKKEFYTTIRHEIIHAIHFAYEHAPLKDVRDPLEDQEEEDNYYDEYDDEDQDDSAYNYYIRHRSHGKGKPKPLPWDTTHNKLNKEKDYYNNRFELESHPADLAAQSFERLKRSNKPLDSLSDRELGSAIITDFRYYVPQADIFTGPMSYERLLRKTNVRKFLSTALKQLKHLISEERP